MSIFSHTGNKYFHIIKYHFFLNIQNLLQCFLRFLRTISNNLDRHLKVSRLLFNRSVLRIVYIQRFGYFCGIYLLTRSSFHGTSHGIAYVSLGRESKCSLFSKSRHGKFTLMNLRDIKLTFLGCWDCSRILWTHNTCV